MAERRGTTYGEFLKEDGFLDLGKVIEYAKDGDLLAVEILFRQNYDPWDDNFGRLNVRTGGRIDGQKMGRGDAEADEVVQSKAELKELGERQFDSWWSAEEPMSNQFYGGWPIETVNLDMVEMRRVYRTGFIEGYLKEAEKAGRNRQTTASPTVRVTNATYNGDTRLYRLELQDPRFLGDPLIFEVGKGSADETFMQETNQAG